MSPSALSGPLQQATDSILKAYETKIAIDPLSETIPDLTLDQAYDIQLAQVAARLASGERLKGYKVGLTSAAMQKQLGVDQSDFGHLTDTMFHLERMPIDDSTFLQPKVEPEIAFVMGRELAGPGVTLPDAIRAVDFVLPAIEIIDSRIRDWKIGLTDTVADNASCGGIVLGSQKTTLDGIDLSLVGCNLIIDSAVVDTGAGGAVLGSPLNALVWLANTLGERGITFQPGDVILPGSCTAAAVVSAGSVVTAQYTGLGSVTAIFGSPSDR